MSQDAILKRSKPLHKMTLFSFKQVDANKFKPSGDQYEGNQLNINVIADLQMQKYYIKAQIENGSG